MLEITFEIVNFAVMKPKVSVIVPVKDRKQLLMRCLDSVLGQSYRPIQLIVVDNGSVDGTPDAAKEWGRSNSSEDFSMEVLSEGKPGACAARNRGLKAATGEYTFFFDSDDTMRPQLLELAMGEFDKDPAADIVCWKADIHQLDGTVKCPSFNPRNPLEDHLVNALLRTQGYITRTEVFRNSGGWNESLPGWNDWELGVRLLLTNPKVAAIEESLVDIYSQPESITGRNFSSKAGQWEKSLTAVCADIEKSSRPDKRWLILIVSYRKMILASHYAKEGSMELAKDLRRQALKDEALTTRHKVLLEFAYHYTRKGGRGAWRILRYFFLRSR